MENTDGTIKYLDEDGNTVEETLFTYSEEEMQENNINRENAKRVFSPKFIPFYPELMDIDLTRVEAIIFGFIDFYASSGSGSGRFYFTNEQLSEIIRCSPDTVGRAVSKLEKMSLISTKRKIKSGGGQIRFIRLDKNYKSDSDGTLVHRLTATPVTNK
jgi:hypothetical protein